jgi:glycine/D-amino acid oxidase-like deaminating enzyme
MSNKITILGAGVSGITTALTLQLLGFETTIFAEKLAIDQTNKDPKFASLYPAASIIPHSITSGKIAEVFSPSQDVFEFLLNNEMPGMQIHRHYEIFEEEKADPDYASFLKNYRRIDPEDDYLPRRPGASSLSGWSFDCLFTEWPIYIKKLFEWYEKAGGKIIRKKISSDDISQFDSKLIVNCCGIWSPDLFEDDTSKYVSKGLLIHLKDAPMLKDSSGQIPSYNYTPGKSIYADADGKAIDVYFYPRTDGWILGGTRIKGSIDKTGSFNGKDYSDTLRLSGLDIPRQVYELNREIILNTYGVDLSKFTEIGTKFGYRYIRSRQEEGLRLEESVAYDKTIIHNYGHGGAGVTLSWGCGAYIAGMIEDITGSSMNVKSSVSRLKDQLSQLID